MNDRELMQQALDALLRVWHSERNTKHSEAIEAIRTRLAQPEQEPVAWGHPNSSITGRKQALMMVALEIPSNAQYPQLWVPLYTSPPQRTWQRLTDEEIDVIDEATWDEDHKSWGIHDFARAIEAKLKEKNT